MLNTNQNKTLIVKKSQLSGNITISGAKNSSLRMLAASILTDEPVIIHNMPIDLIDVKIHIDMLKCIGKEITIKKNSIYINNKRPLSNRLFWEGISIRNTLLIFGALLSRFSHAMVPLPGGCNLGMRPFDLHLMILKNKGVDIWHDDKYLYGTRNSNLKEGNIFLTIPSSGATENAIITSCLAHGVSIIYGAYITPEIIDLIDLLNKMGGKIIILGPNSIRVTGVSFLNGVQHTVIPDIVESVTFIIASAITNGRISIHNFPFHLLLETLYKLEKIGVNFETNDKHLVVSGENFNPFDICANVYPSIYSDMQPLFSVLGLCANGRSSIVDLRWPNRFQYVQELLKMGGNLTIRNGGLLINGKSSLKGNIVYAHDLRCGASLILAGLVADGTTTIINSWQIDRGYERITEKLQKLKGNIIEANM